METFGGLTKQKLRDWLSGRTEFPVLVESVEDAIADLFRAYEEKDVALERAKRERDANKEDAERYRWLRERERTDELDEHGIYIGVDSHLYMNQWALYGEEADAAIDAAREGKVTPSTSSSTQETQ